MELVRLLLRLLHWSGALRHPSPAAGCYPLYSAALLGLTACFVATQVVCWCVVLCRQVVCWCVVLCRQVVCWCMGLCQQVVCWCVVLCRQVVCWCVVLCRQVVCWCVVLCRQVVCWCVVLCRQVVCWCVVLCRQVAAVVDRQAGADLDQATLALCVASTMCVAICKVLNILRSEQLFLRLAHEVTTQPDGLSAWERAAWVASARRVRRLSAVYGALAASMAVTWPAAPLVARGGGGALPFVARFPFDVGAPAGYAAAFAFQLVVVGVVAVVVPCSDLFTVACVQRLGTLLRILERRVERLGAAASGGPRPTPATGRAVAGADPLHRALRDCVSLHQRIISEAECLNQAVGGALLPQVVASAAGICFLLFQVAKKTSFHVVETGKLLGYLTFMLSQLLFYCWFGDDMLSKSERVALAAYRCAWPGAPPHFQRALLLVSMRARKPLTLRAGKFFVFSRQAFVQVMNVSYSYFTVLRSLSEA
ncbi:odorant receptor Or2-like [Schistocerca cancellata]|uniref:odorant receptor Or2-like n=1 Tax=Schistocerca cancellata TaxID=274614 RepID=UPI002118BBFA|nr:odorant receptor Or2-like [Schistocerca cancellata]